MEDETIKERLKKVLGEKAVPLDIRQSIEDYKERLDKKKKF
ncbi:MAG: hypothetical protein O8C63_11405 [Candidatus Methanoperedens sp.]|nr:hypothetical protein [Candidatus Methanoperedens sp.]